MANQYVDFKTAQDSGTAHDTSIQPIQDGEAVTADALNRPAQLLRARTEVLRGEVEALKYLADADRAFTLEGAGKVTWTADDTRGTFALEAGGRIVLRPFLAPHSNTQAQATLPIAEGVLATLTTQRAAWQGANRIQLTLRVGTAEALGISGTIDVQEVSGSAPMDALELRVVTDTPWGEVQTTVNAHLVFTSRQLTLSVPEAHLATGVAVSLNGTLRMLAGGLDAEAHELTAVDFGNFFATPDNHMLEGDVLAVGYDALVLPLGGGRRQSKDDMTSVGANLFLLRRFPEKAPGALPLCRVVRQDGKLVLLFINQTALYPGATLPLLSNAYSAYAELSAKTNDDQTTTQGQLVLHSSSAPDNAATLDYDTLTTLTEGGDATLLHSHEAQAASAIPFATAKQWLDGQGLTATTVKAAVDEIVTDLSDAAGSKRVGHTTSGTVHGALTAVDGRITEHLNDTVGAHAASAIRFTPVLTPSITAVNKPNVQEALAYHIYPGYDTIDNVQYHRLAHLAANIRYEAPPAGLTTYIASAGHVQGALESLDVALKATSDALTTHDHASVYAPIVHTHTGVYAPVVHSHEGAYAAITHNHNNDYVQRAKVYQNLWVDGNEFRMDLRQGGTDNSLSISTIVRLRLPSGATLRSITPYGITGAVSHTVVLEALNPGTRDWDAVHTLTWEMGDNLTATKSFPSEYTNSDGNALQLRVTLSGIGNPTLMQLKGLVLNYNPGINGWVA